MTKINFIDVGCSGYMPGPWSIDKFGRYIDNIVGFDLLKNELNYLDEEFPNNKIYNNVVFDKEISRSFYICKRSRVSGLFKPNIPVLIPYIEILNKIRKPKIYNISKYDVEKIEKVKCIRLDTIIDELNIDFDFLKTDTEGADYQVIKSLGEYLTKQVVGIHTELYFKKMYKGIVLFDEVNDFLTNNGFYQFKQVGGVEDYWGNFLYIREDKKKKKKIDLIKRAYQNEN